MLGNERLNKPYELNWTELKNTINYQIFNLNIKIKTNIFFKLLSGGEWAKNLSILWPIGSIAVDNEGIRKHVGLCQVHKH